MPFFGFGKRAGGRRKAGLLAALGYEPGESVLHRLDPRTKILVLVAVSLAALFFSSFSAMLLLLAGILVLAGISGLPWRLLRGFLLLSPFLVILVLLDSLFPKISSGPVFWSTDFWILHAGLSPGGILFGITMGLRFLCIAGFSFLFIMTTSHDDFIRSLKAGGIPPTLSFSLGYALRSTTTLAGDIRQIMDAQRSRGLDFDGGGLVRNRTNLMALFTPVTVSLLKRSQHVTDAMLSRGFSRAPRKSCYHACRFGQIDAVMLLAVAGFIVVLVLVERAGAMVG